MWRVMVAALLVANLAFWTWSQGWLDRWIDARRLGDREPQRLAQQVHPERIRIVVPDAPAASEPAQGAPTGVTRADSASDASETWAQATSEPAGADSTAAEAVAASAALPCFETPALAAAGLPVAEAVLVRAALPPGSWRVVPFHRPGTWIVHMGLFTTRTQARARAIQLREIGLGVEELRGVPSLEPGLSFGRFDERADADRHAASLAAMELGPLRVLTIETPVTLHRLRIDAADAAVQQRIATLKLRALGGGFVRCEGGAAQR